jgi:hypothetical protein
MKQVALPTFSDERTRFALRFTCEHCTYFRVEDERCMHGYPNAEHREQRYAAGAPQQQSLDPTAAQSPAPALVFCKEFELV